MNWKTFWKVIGVLVVLGFLLLCGVTACVGSFVFGRNSDTTLAAFGLSETLDKAGEITLFDRVAPARENNEATMENTAQVNIAAPVLHHADSHAPEEGVGSFDVGVKNGQIGIAFGWHLLWPKGGLDAGGGGCDLLILTPGWYENFQVLDGRYEVYDVPSDDYNGWVEVLGQQRADEQAANYGCPAKSFEDLPQWESPIPSPP